MIDAHDFTRWVRTQDTRLAPILQGLFDLYIRGRDNRARTTKPENADTLYFTVDDCYRVVHTTRAGVALPDTTRRITAGVLRLPGLRICGNAGASHCWRVCLAE